MPYEFFDGQQEHLTLRVVGSKSFEVVHGFRYRDQYDGDQAYEVPNRFGPTDLASVPFFLQWLVLSYGKHTMAALVHDVYWDNTRTQAQLRQANTAFRHAMWESEVPYIRRWFMWTAVTLGMLTKAWSGRIRVLVWVAGLIVAAAAALASADVVLSYAVPWRVGVAAAVLAGAAALAWALGSGAIAGICRRVVTLLVGLMAVLALFAWVGHLDWVADHGGWVALGALAVALAVWGKLIAAGVFATLEVGIILVPVVGICLGLLLYVLLEGLMLGLLKVGRAIKGASGRKPIGTLNPIASENLKAPDLSGAEANLKASQV